MAINFKNTDSLVTSVITRMLVNKVDITDFNVGSIIRTELEAIAAKFGYDGELDSVYNQLLEIIIQTGIDTASETYLDRLGALVGVIRKGGDYATGEVSFIFPEDQTTNLLIPAGTVVATSVNDENGQKIFETTESVTFLHSITAEEHGYKDGVFDYPLNSRYFQTISNFSGTTSGGAYFFVEDTDYEIQLYDDDILIIDDSFVQIEDFEDKTEWTVSTSDVLEDDTGDYIQGTQSIKASKANITDSYMSLHKTLSSSVNINVDGLRQWIHIVDFDTLNKITKIEFILGNTDAVNSFIYTLYNSDLSVGRKNYFLTNFKTQGAPDALDIDYLQIKIHTNNASDTFSQKILFDALLGGTIEYYNGNVITFLQSGATRPTDDTDFSVTYFPLSIEVACEAIDPGTAGNIAANRIIFLNSSIPRISTVNNMSAFTSGTDEEEDDVYRARIKNYTSSLGKATESALKSALEDLSFVSNATVIDRPPLSVTNESHVYNSSVDTYKLFVDSITLDDDVAPTNITISDTYGGSADYTYGTDYIISDNFIEWQSGGSAPTNGDFFYVNYDVKLLGHSFIYVSGFFSSFTSDQEDTITETIEDTKAAGVVVNWAEPEVQYVNVTAAFTFESGYSLTADKETEITTALNNYIINLEAEEDVILSKLISAVLDVTGVTDVSFTAPAANVTVDSGKKAKLGTVTLS